MLARALEYNIQEGRNDPMRFRAVLLALFIGTAAAQLRDDGLARAHSPADHWTQEPDGFNGMRFGATRAETEKVIKPETCKTGDLAATSCKVTLTVAGKPFQGGLLFLVPRDLETGAPVGEAQLNPFTPSSRGPILLL